MWSSAAGTPRSWSHSLLGLVWVTMPLRSSADFACGKRRPTDRGRSLLEQTTSYVSQLANRNQRIPINTAHGPLGVATMNLIESLKRYTTVVADTGDFETIAQYKPQDATTNPSLLFLAAQKPQYENLVSAALQAAAQSTGNEKERTEAFMDHLLINFGCAIL